MIPPLTEMDEEPPVALSLILRHCHYAGDVILLLAVFLLREVADQVTALAVILGQHIEQERFHVVVQGLVVEEQFRKEAQVLAVYFVRVAVHFEDGYVAAPVDLGGGRVPP